MPDREITVRVDRLDLALDREIEKREQSDKYRHNLAEDVQSRYSEINSRLTGLQNGFLQHMIDDKDEHEKLDYRLRVIERLSYLAIGSTAILGALWVAFASKIVQLLGTP